MPAAALILAVLLAEPPAGATVAPNTVRPVRDGSAVRAAQQAPGPVRRVDRDADAGPLRGDLEIVDAGVEDTGALGTSFRKSAHDSRLPTGFQRVYRVPGEEGKLMRGNGALFAVFPESVYRRLGRGAVSLTPPGTVYHIGMPGELHLAPTAAPTLARAPQQIDGRVYDQLGPEAVSGVSRVDMRVDGRVGTAGDAAKAAGDPSNAAGDPSNAAGAVRQGTSAGGTNVSVPAATAAPVSVPPLEASLAASVAGDVYAHLRLGPARVVRE